tara:strand:- start:990 stop:1571 length:582 start_codon:yes stop_codon:yes gene_type:complete
MEIVESPDGISVFCGSRIGYHKSYFEAGRQLGKSLGRAGIRIIYGGGSQGIMGTLADAALEAGGEVVGVIPRFMVDREWAHPGISKLHIVDSLHQRKEIMLQASQYLIALPGGFGTLEELTEVVSWAQLNLHHKQIFLANISNFYDKLLSFLDDCVKQGFTDTHHRQLLTCIAGVDELISTLSELEPNWKHLA